MKIISGQYRGAPLYPPKNTVTRPTSAMVREAIFNMLAPRIEDSRFLDLFCGGGAMGLEALSWGAGHCVFVDQDKAAMAATRKNIAELTRKYKDDLATRTQCIEKKLESSWASLKGQEFDLIWADPPYQEAIAWFEVLSRELPALLKEDGLFLLELDRSATEALDAKIKTGPWRCQKKKSWGRTSVFVLAYEPQ